MTFLIEALPEDTLQNLFALDRQALEAVGAARVLVEDVHSAPCRISLEDAAPGEEVILASFEHQPAATAYRQAGPIFVRRSVARARPAPGEIPPALHRRTLSIRAYDAAGNMVDADLVDGRDAEPLIERFFARSDVDYLHAHYARRGCYAAKIRRG
jgi:hypothetical protein